MRRGRAREQDDHLRRPRACAPQDGDRAASLTREDDEREQDQRDADEAVDHGDDPQQRDDGGEQRAAARRETAVHDDVQALVLQSTLDVRRPCAGADAHGDLPRDPGRARQRGRVEVGDAPVARELLDDAGDARAHLPAVPQLDHERRARCEAEAVGEAAADLGLARAARAVAVEQPPAGEDGRLALAERDERDRLAEVEGVDAVRLVALGAFRAWRLSLFAGGAGASASLANVTALALAPGLAGPDADSDRGAVHLCRIAAGLPRSGQPA